jgi:hypothetical protein
MRGTRAFFAPEELDLDDVFFDLFILVEIPNATQSVVVRFSRNKPLSQADYRLFPFSRENPPLTPLAVLRGRRRSAPQGNPHGDLRTPDPPPKASPGPSVREVRRKLSGNHRLDALYQGTAFSRAVKSGTNEG